MKLNPVDMWAVYGSGDMPTSVLIDRRAAEVLAERLSEDCRWLVTYKVLRVTITPKEANDEAE